MAAVHVRVCVDCHEEYRPEIARCADCGGVLQDRYDDDDGERGRAPRPSPRPAAAPGAARRRRGPIATSEHARQLVPLADRLLEARTRSSASSPGGWAGRSAPRGFELRVPDADRERRHPLPSAPVAGPDTGVTLLVAGLPRAADDADDRVAVPRVRHAGGAVSDGVRRVRARPRGRALERQKRGDRRKERRRTKREVSFVGSRNAWTHVPSSATATVQRT